LLVSLLWVSRRSLGLSLSSSYCKRRQNRSSFLSLTGGSDGASTAISPVTISAVTVINWEWMRAWKARCMGVICVLEYELATDRATPATHVAPTSWKRYWRSHPHALWICSGLALLKSTSCVLLSNSSRLVSAPMVNPAQIVHAAMATFPGKGNERKFELYFCEAAITTPEMPVPRRNPLKAPR